jgi:hypothetical protein
VTRSAKLVIYLIAANAALLMLFVLTSRIITEVQTGDRLGLYFVSICLGIGTGQACLMGPISLVQISFDGFHDSSWHNGVVLSFH